MGKTKRIWVCSECGHHETKWIGQCPLCTNWNTFQEEVEVQASKYHAPKAIVRHPLPIKEIAREKQERFLTQMCECDRLFGGGLVPGALILVGGEPGIGKSTWLLQLSNALAKQGKRVLYICGEESLEQTSLRAHRLGVDAESLFLHSETQLSQIRSAIEQIKPEFLVIDSIQIVYKEEIPSSPGSVSQVREVAHELMQLAKGEQITTFLIGHVTKSGEIAGPRLLEHLVDTVLYFEGDKQNHYRMVRAVKNRFGPTDEIAVFQMQPQGLIEVANPSQIFLQERREGAVGSVVIPGLEGSRALLIEAQALVTPTPFTTPSRRSTGIDPNRLALLIAVLEKRLRFPLFRHDVFVSIVGGVHLAEPGIDLGLLLAIASSLKNRPIAASTLVVGEVGLGGEVRAVSRLDSRVKEAIHLGFAKCLVPEKNLKSLSGEFAQQIDLVGIENVEQAVKYILN